MVIRLKEQVLDSSRAYFFDFIHKISGINEQVIKTGRYTSEVRARLEETIKILKSSPIFCVYVNNFSITDIVMKIEQYTLIGSDKTVLEEVTSLSGQIWIQEQCVDEPLFVTDTDYNLITIFIKLLLSIQKMKRNLQKGKSLYELTHKEDIEDLDFLSEFFSGFTQLNR